MSDLLPGQHIRLTILLGKHYASDTSVQYLTLYNFSQYFLTLT